MVLGSGTFGQVFDFCDAKQSCKYVLKLQTLQAAKPNKCYSPTDMYMREVFYHLYVQTHARGDIAPKLIDHWVCTDASIADPQSLGIGCILMERWEGSLNNRTLTPRELDMFVMQSNKWIVELARLKIEHRDVFSRNILFRGAGNKIEFRLSDWGLAIVNSNTTQLQSTYATAFELIITKEREKERRDQTQLFINLVSESLVLPPK